MNYKSILVPIEGSQQSYDAVDYAVEMARLFDNCSITLCYVIEESILKPLSKYQRENIKVLSEKYEEQGKIYLNKAINIAKKKNFKDNLIKTTILKGDPGEKLVEFSTKFDLIVMTVRAKQHSLENTIGKVTKYVISASKIPVLVVT
jgi:nucleotide-binding universal stress UspA family protein